MTVNQIIHIVAGTFIILTLGLGVEASPLFHNSNWLWMTLFVGFNLLQSGFTKFCPLEMILRAVGIGSDANGNSKDENCGC